ncbi:MAG: geranyl transferase, partial [Gemmatimonas sp.]
MSEDTSRTFAAERIAVQRALDGFCARWLGDVAPLTAEAIRYALLGEGKRLRAVLLLEAYRACGGTGDALDLA